MTLSEQKKDEIKDAMKVIIAGLLQDAEYRLSWKANIALCMFDALRNYDDSSPLDICNKAAEDFLKILTGETK
jgi:hypothetical protein